jgi:hypothetical protein
MTNSRTVNCEDVAMPTKRELEQRVHELEAHLEETSDRAREVLGYEDENDELENEDEETP